MALTPPFVNASSQGARKVTPFPIPADGNQKETGTAGNATTITVTGQSERNVIVRQVAWSYSAAPTNGGVTITDGTTTYFDLHVTAGGPDAWIFSPPLAMPEGLSAVVTLAAPGGAVVGKLFVNAYVEQ